MAWKGARLTARMGARVMAKRAARSTQKDFRGMVRMADLRR
jgi:hypothetical protein